MFKLVILEYDIFSRASFTTGLETQSVERSKSKKLEVLSETIYKRLAGKEEKANFE